MPTHNTLGNMLRAVGPRGCTNSLPVCNGRQHVSSFDSQDESHHLLKFEPQKHSKVMTPRQAVQGVLWRGHQYGERYLERLT